MISAGLVWAVLIGTPAFVVRLACMYLHWRWMANAALLVVYLCIVLAVLSVVVVPLIGAAVGLAGMLLRHLAAAAATLWP